LRELQGLKPHFPSRLYVAAEAATHKTSSPFSSIWHRRESALFGELHTGRSACATAAKTNGIQTEAKAARLKGEAAATKEKSKAKPEQNQRFSAG
jgi:hypothetical protein